MGNEYILLADEYQQNRRVTFDNQWQRFFFFNELCN